MKKWPPVVILIIYLMVGTLYVAYTPLWQAPDEPAHYNYIRALVEERRLPVMESGDYDQAYLDSLTTEGFPPGSSVASLEYEDHQPPLYYILAAPVYWAFQGSVRAVRHASLLLGGVSITMVFLILREFWPTQPGIAWLGGGIAALIPQFIAATTSINNDALLFALLWLWLWLALRYLRGLTPAWLLGCLAGAILLTKSTGYGVLPLMLLVIYLRYRRAGMPLQWAIKQLLEIALPALALGGLWWVRNAVVYGWPDVMGLQRHNDVVIGQPRTADWVAGMGFLPFLWTWLRTTFRSFWGQFGWMGVVLDARIYQGLTIFTLLSLFGAVWRLTESTQQGMEPRQRDALILLGTSALITLAMYLGYNLTFVQHQGRYLFPALPTLALGAALGWERMTQRRLAIGITLILVLIAAAFGVAGLIVGDVAVWLVAMLIVAALTVSILAFVPQPWYGLLIGGLLVAMAALDLWCLFGFIVPML